MDQSGLPWRVGTLGFLLIAAMCAIGAFYQLDTASLTTDEFFTAYFADASQISTSAAISRIAEDVHPPGYYLLTWASLRLFGGDFTLTARALSAFLSVATLVVIYFSFPRKIGQFTRLFAVAGAATSSAWFYYAQEARSYALVFLLSAALLFIGLRILRALPSGSLALPLLAALGGVGLASALSHYYLLLLAGSVVGMLLLFTWNWGQRVALVVTGFAILLPVVAFISWHEGQIVVDTQKTWFSVDAKFLGAHLYKGFLDIQRPLLRAILVFAFFASWVLLFLKRPITQKSSDDISQICIFVTGCCFGPLLAGIVISFLSDPIFSFRMFLVIAPFIWLLVGLIGGYVFSRLKAKLFWPLLCITLIVFTSISLSRFFGDGLSQRENWRDSAAFVEQMPGCTGKTIPVVGFEQDYISANEADVFYGYYMDVSQPKDWLKISFENDLASLSGTALPGLIKARITDEQQCPLLLWSVHHWSRADIEAFVKDVGEQISVPVTRSIKISEFGLDSYVVMVE